MFDLTNKRIGFYSLDTDKKPIPEAGTQPTKVMPTVAVKTSDLIFGTTSSVFAARVAGFVLFCLATILIGIYCFFTMKIKTLRVSNRLLSP